MYLVLVLVRYVAETHTRFGISEAEGPASARMAEGAGIGTKRTLRGGKHKPRPKPSGKLKNGIKTRRLLDDRRFNRCRVQQMSAVKHAAMSQRPVKCSQALSLWYDHCPRESRRCATLWYWRRSGSVVDSEKLAPTWISGPAATFPTWSHPHRGVGVDQEALQPPVHLQPPAPQ